MILAPTAKPVFRNETACLIILLLVYYYTLFYSITYLFCMSSLLPFSTPPPPPVLCPRLSINAKGRAYLSQDLIAHLNLRNKQPGNILPPTANNPCWYLDLRPTNKRYISWYQSSGDKAHKLGTRPRIEGIELPTGLIAPGQLVRLQLVPGAPEFPGFYPLLPDAYFTPKQAPALAASAA